MLSVFFTVGLAITCLVIGLILGMISEVGTTVNKVTEVVLYGRDHNDIVYTLDKLIEEKGFIATKVMAYEMGEKIEYMKKYLLIQELSGIAQQQNKNTKGGV